MDGVGAYACIKVSSVAPQVHPEMPLEHHDDPSGTPSRRFVFIVMKVRFLNRSQFFQMRYLVCGSALAVLTAGCTSISPPPPRLEVNAFYTQYLDARGIPITGSARVSPAALRRARSIATQMLDHRPDIRAALIAMGARVAIMAQSEGTTDLPEQATWKKPAIDDPVLTYCERKHYDERIGRLSDREYWNSRARGMGGLLTSGAEENLLAVPGSKYFGENIFVHEFSHEIMAGIERADPELYRRIKARYGEAKAAGLWKGEYAETTAEEYWAEGTQFWFNSNKLAVIDGRRVLSDRDLAAYDPALYDLLRQVYGSNHRLKADAFYGHPARVPSGPPRQSTAEVC